MQNGWARILHEISDYTQTISDLEQTLAGEEQDLDLLLRQDVVAQSVPVQQPTLSSPKSAVMASPLDDQPSHTQYQSLINWMGNCYKKI